MNVNPTLDSYLQGEGCEGRTLRGVAESNASMAYDLRDNPQYRYEDDCALGTYWSYLENLRDTCHEWGLSPGDTRAAIAVYADVAERLWDPNRAEWLLGHAPNKTQLKITFTSSRWIG